MFAAIAWACAVGGTALAVPQFARIIRRHSSAGVSLVAWQLWCTIGAAWAVHGAIGGSFGMFLPNAASAVLSTLIIAMIVRDRKLSLVDACTLPLIVATAAIALRIGVGPVAFSIFMLVPQAVAVLGQLADLVRSDDLAGVSGAYLHSAVAMQALWLSYGIFGNDVACTISSIMMIILVATNLVIFALRWHGRLTAHPSFARRLAV